MIRVLRSAPISSPRQAGKSVERERFGARELAICLSHYDLGIIESIEDFVRGSRRSPKVILQSQRGRFLFKRRASGRETIQKVAFTHQIQLHLAAQNFPLPHLIGTRDANNSMLVWGEHIYELFEFIAGGNYTGSLDATYNAGRILGLYHKLMEGFRSDYNPPTGSYHDARAIHNAIRSSVSSLPPETRPPEDEMARTVESIEKHYHLSARQANELGLRDWPAQIVHGDWHPGNMLFRHQHVAAVIDYDSARLYQRVIDFANGALQFSIIGGSEDPGNWPAYVDESRYKRFLMGYDSVNVISQAEVRAAPFLMCEAMIAEAVLPIAATGSFGRMEGFPFLQMIDRKVRWILAHLEQMQSVLS